MNFNRLKKDKTALAKPAERSALRPYYRSKSSLQETGEIIGAGLVILFWVAVIGVAITFPSFLTMWLWNDLVPKLFHGPKIGFWEAFGLLMLISIIGKAINGNKSEKE